MITSIYYELPIVWDSKDSVQLEKLGIESHIDEVDRLTIDLSEIVAFNPAYEKNQTTIRTSFGSIFMVECSYEKFKKFFEEQTGIVIHIYG